MSEVERLIESLRDAGVRWQAAEALVGIGAPAVGPLCRALRHEDVWVRRHAAEALGKIGDVQAVKPLCRALRDEDTDVRWQAVVALGAIGDARAVEPLRRALGDRDERVCKAAEEALGKMGS